MFIAEHFDAEPRGFWLPGMRLCARLGNSAAGSEPALVHPRRSRIFPGETASRAERSMRRALRRRAQRPSRVISNRAAKSGVPNPVIRESRSIGNFIATSGSIFRRSTVFADSTSKTPRFTGLKYHRVTGRGPHKEIYNRDWAESAARAHAEHFLASRLRQLEQLPSCDFEPIITMPFDAELFGHWWYEGPLFLEHFIRQAARSRR